MKKVFFSIVLSLLFTGCVTSSSQNISQSDIDTIAVLNTSYTLKSVCGQSPTLEEAVVIARRKCKMDNKITAVYCQPAGYWSFVIEKDDQSDPTAPYGCAVYKDKSAEVLYGGTALPGQIPKREIIP